MHRARTSVKRAQLRQEEDEEEEEEEEPLFPLHLHDNRVLADWYSRTQPWVLRSSFPLRVRRELPSERTAALLSEIRAINVCPSFTPRDRDHSDSGAPSVRTARARPGRERRRQARAGDAVVAGGRPRGGGGGAANCQNLSLSLLLPPSPPSPDNAIHNAGLVRPAAAAAAAQTSLSGSPPHRRRRSRGRSP